VTGRHRAKGVKREHGIIAGLLPVLERIATSPAVASVTPGRIRVTRAATQSLELRLGPATISGVKLTARRGTTAQEVFLVTGHPDAVVAFLRREIKEFVA
jgi:hypothetical protein